MKFRQFSHASEFFRRIRMQPLEIRFQFRMFHFRMFHFRNLILTNGNPAQIYFTGQKKNDFFTPKKLTFLIGIIGIFNFYKKSLKPSNWAVTGQFGIDKTVTVRCHIAHVFVSNATRPTGIYTISLMEISN